MNKLANNQQGTALLLALLMMSGLVVIGVVLGDMTISELRQSRNLDQSMVAYYGAESGAERALYEWRHNDGEEGFGDASCLDEENLSSVGWSCEANFSNLTELNFILPQLVVKEIPLYVADQLNVSSGINSATIDWQAATTTNTLEYPWLEVTLLGWDASDTQVNFLDDASVTKRVFACSPASVGDIDCDQAVINDFQTNFSYIIRLRATHRDVSNVRMRFFDGGGSLVTLEDYIKSGDFTGEYEGIKQGLRVQVPVTHPTSGMFDYVIFSEESMLKNFN